MRRTFRIWAVVAMCALLTACGGGSAPSPEVTIPATPPAATPTATAAPTLTMSDIVWAEAADPATGAPVDEVDGFTTESPAIVALVEVTNLEAGTQFTASWTLNDTPIEGANLSVTADKDMDQAWIAFRFTRDEQRRYPLGQLSVTITASDGGFRESSIEIGFP